MRWDALTTGLSPVSQGRSKRENAGMSIVDSELHQYKKSIDAHWDIASPACLLWFNRNRVEGKKFQWF